MADQRSAPGSSEQTLASAANPAAPAAASQDTGAAKSERVPVTRESLNWVFQGASAQAIAVENGTLKLDTVYFQLGKPLLDERSLSTVDTLAALLEKHATIERLRIEGHTDSRGSGAFNLQLSAARAHAVARALVERGIPCRRLEPVGYGETRPITDNRTSAGRARNRRMEFHIARHDGSDVLPAISESDHAKVYDPCAELVDSQPATIAY